MHTYSLGNEPSFGIRYKNKKFWDKKTLKTFEDSELLKEINKKYPNATVSLRKYSEIDEYNIWHMMFLEIALTSQKIYSWGLASLDTISPSIQLVKKLNSLTLSQIEKKAITNNNSTQNNKLNILNTIFNKFLRIFS